jgi:hypothetical protein
MLPGRYLCGIECDGAMYHSSETARDRDRLRQQVLEARGWTIYRLWSTDWFKDREGQIERLLNLIKQAQLSIQAQQLAEAEARNRLASLGEAIEQEDNESGDTGEAALASNPEKKSLAQAAPYVLAKTPLLYPGQDLNEAPASRISHAINEIVAVEAPLHIKDLASRIVARWGYNVVGPGIMRRIRSVLEYDRRAGKIILRGDYVFDSNSVESVAVRSRAGTNIPADRIAPEEYRAAILLALQTGDGIDRKILINTVRALFGFSRTGPNLEAAIVAAIESLLADQTIGEGSTGIKLRT